MSRNHYTILISAVAIVLLSVAMVGCSGDTKKFFPDGDIDQNKDQDVIDQAIDGDTAELIEEIAEEVFLEMDEEVVDVPDEAEADPELEPEPEVELEPEIEMEPEIEYVDNGVYRSTGNPWFPGPLPTATIKLNKGNYQAPTNMIVITPTVPGTYALIMFNHGFLLANSYYSTILNHLASHGFVVVAPQMYLADGVPIGKPTTDAEADLFQLVTAWLPANINTITSVNVNLFQTGFAGHSRGGKVIWKVLRRDQFAAKAVAGIDPVDSANALTGETRVASTIFSLPFPSYILGTGLGPQGNGVLQPACAPAGDNSVNFYGASSPPAYHVIATEYGHLDMLDDETPGCSFTCSACITGPGDNPRTLMRALVSGHLAAYFIGTLQGDPTMFDVLKDAAASPVNITVDYK